MDQPPHPDHGWSRGVTVVENAVVVPPRSFGEHPVCGVWGPDGDVPEAAHWRDEKRVPRPLAEPPEPAARLSGTHLFGGFLFGHFGHFVVESLARLWLTSEPAQGWLFLPRRVHIKGVQRLHRPFFNLLAPEMPVSLLREPVAVERLVIPGQGFGLGAIARGTPEFRAMLRLWTARIRSNGPRRIYVSRSALGGQGGVLNETAIERNLASEGYAIMHPQTMTLREQLIWYKSASHVLGLDGSAFHLLGLVARPEQTIGIILRRSTGDYANIAAQIEGMQGHPPAVIDALRANWMPPDRANPNFLSTGELDHAALAERLEAGGFIAKAQAWRAPEEAEVEEAIRAVEAAGEQPLVRRVV